MSVDLAVASRFEGLSVAGAASRSAPRHPNLARVFAFLVLGGPIVAGLALTIALAFGYLPALGGKTPSLAPWLRLLARPGLAASLRLTITVGFLASAFSLALAFAMLAALSARSRGRALESALAPLLASPHSAIAVGFAFLVAPSGWLIRLVSPWATGFAEPPDVATVGDPYGIALAAGLVVKETPFLLAVALGTLGQFPAKAELSAARALGHAPAAAWLKIVAPQVYARIRLPVYAVIAYSLSVVDMAFVLAPSHPAPLSVLSLRWFLSPDLADVFLGAAAATLQLCVVVGAIGLWRLGEAGARRLALILVSAGRRGAAIDTAARTLALFGSTALALGMASLAVLVVWAFTWRWSFPHALPEAWTLDIVLRQAPLLVRPLGSTLALAVLSASAALALAVAWLESDDRAGRRSGAAIVYLPLVMPQIAFLFGAEYPVRRARSRRLVCRRRLGACALRVSLCDACHCRSVARARSPICPRRRRARHRAHRDADPGETADPHATARPGLRHRRRRVGRAISLHPVRRRRTGRDADH